MPRIDADVTDDTNTVEVLPTGNEKILFVDDEMLLVDIGAQMLRRLGSRVDGRTSPYEALEAFKANPGKYDVVISDMTMPGMSGKDLAGALLQIRPDLPVIICTGFSTIVCSETWNVPLIKDYLMKPLTMSDFSKSIRKVIDRVGETNDVRN